MLASARVAHVARRSDDFGVETGNVVVDLKKVVERKNRIVKQWRSGQEAHVVKRRSLDLYRGTGRFVSPHTVAVDEYELSSEHIFINTGARPRYLNIPGLEDVDVLTNRNIMDLEQVPEHLLVLGGSYIGLEFGQMFRRFGSRVTVIEYEEQIAPREDEDVAQALREALEAEGIEFHLRVQASSVRATSDGLALTVHCPSRLVSILEFMEGFQRKLQLYWHGIAGQEVLDGVVIGLVAKFPTLDAAYRPRGNG